MVAIENVPNKEHKSKDRRIQERGGATYDGMHFRAVSGENIIQKERKQKSAAAETHTQREN